MQKFTVCFELIVFTIGYDDAHFSFQWMCQTNECLSVFLTKCSSEIDYTKFEFKIILEGFSVNFGFETPKYRM